MAKNSLSRREFLRLGSLSTGAFILAACGPNTAEQQATATPIPSASEPETSGASDVVTEDGVEILVGDVLDYQLETDQWTGQYGFVTLRLHEGIYNGEPIYFVCTDTSDATYAEENKLVYVPLLNAGGTVASSYYEFANGRLPVLGTAPSEENYISLFQLKRVTINDDSLTLDSAAAIEEAAGNGGVTIEEQPIYLNHPIVKWPGGELPADPENTETLGLGPLTEPVNTDDMTVTFKLHQCFPGSRYIITDTSAAPMAPMMGIVASPPAQTLMETGATDEIWVFANGIEGSGVMGFQPAIFDNKAGEPAWSPFWNHFTLMWTEGNEPRILRNSAEIRAGIEAGELELFNGVPDSHPNGFVVNCPAPILAPNTFGA